MFLGELGITIAKGAIPLALLAPGTPNTPDQSGCDPAPSITTSDYSLTSCDGYVEIKVPQKPDDPNLGDRLGSEWGEDFTRSGCIATGPIAMLVPNDSREPAIARIATQGKCIFNKDFVVPQIPIPKVTAL